MIFTNVGILFVLTVLCVGAAKFAKYIFMRLQELSELMMQQKVQSEVQAKALATLESITTESQNHFKSTIASGLEARKCEYMEIMRQSVALGIQLDQVAEMTFATDRSMKAKIETLETFINSDVDDRKMQHSEIQLSIVSIENQFKTQKTLADILETEMSYLSTSLNHKLVYHSQLLDTYDQRATAMAKSLETSINAYSNKRKLQASDVQMSILSIESQLKAQTTIIDKLEAEMSYLSTSLNHKLVHHSNF